MSDVILVITVWTLISILYLATGLGFWRWARTIDPVYLPWPLFALGSGFVVFGLIGIGTASAAIYRYSLGFNPAYEGIGAVAYIRMTLGVTFTAYIAALVNLVAHRAAKFNSRERELQNELAQAFFRLKKATAKVSYVTGLD